MDFKGAKKDNWRADRKRIVFTVVQVAGEGGMGEEEVVEVGVLLECWKISSSSCPGGEVATSVWAAGDTDTGGGKQHDQF